MSANQSANPVPNPVPTTAQAPAMAANTAAPQQLAAMAKGTPTGLYGSAMGMNMPHHMGGMAAHYGAMPYGGMMGGMPGLQGGMAAGAQGMPGMAGPYGSYQATGFAAAPIGGAIPMPGAMTPPAVAIGGGGGTGGVEVPGLLPTEQSYIENILRLNLGKIATIYMTFENNSQWNAKVFKGRLEAAGRDHIIISDPQSGMRYLLLMVNLDYITFDEELAYTYTFGGQTFGLIR